MEEKSTEWYMTVISLDKFSYWENITAVFAYTFLAYTDLFLQYLILSFAKKK